MTSMIKLQGDQSVGVAEYTDSISVEGKNTSTIVLDMTLNNLMVMLL